VTNMLLVFAALGLGVVVAYAAGYCAAWRYWRARIQAAHRYEVEAEERACNLERELDRVQGNARGVLEYMGHEVSDNDRDPSFALGVIAMAYRHQAMDAKERLGKIVFHLWDERDAALADADFWRQTAIDRMRHLREWATQAVERRKRVDTERDTANALLRECLYATAATSEEAEALKGVPLGEIPGRIAEVVDGLERERDAANARCAELERQLGLANGLLDGSLMRDATNAVIAKRKPQVGDSWCLWAANNGPGDPLEYDADREAECDQLAQEVVNWEKQQKSAEPEKGGE
jgi:hypothetical protein